MKYYSTLLLLLLTMPTVLAQLDQEVNTGILRGLLGNLPNPCSDITSSLCIYCLGYVKLLPFAFFFGLFYFILSYGIRYFIKNDDLSTAPSIKVGIILICLALSFFTIQSAFVGGALSRIADFKEWVEGLIFILIMTFIVMFLSRIMNSILHHQIGLNPVTMISILGITLVLLIYLWSHLAIFAGGPKFVVAIIAFIGVGMFFHFFFQGFLHNLTGIALILLFIILFAVLRGDIGSGFVPILFQENPNFDLGICQ